MNEKKIPKKKRFHTTRKPIFVGGIVSIVALAGIVAGVVWYLNIKPKKRTLILGTWDAPSTWIDPLETWATNALIENTAEGLFTVDVRSNNSEIINNLALNYMWSTDDLNLTCTLRQDVEFHDGTPFNASAVKWNIDRIYGLIDAMIYPELWKLPDGRFIINETLVMDDYIIRFVLNAPFAPLKNLLASWTSYILSPTSTPPDDFLNPNSEYLVGTGPFVYDDLEINVSYSLTANLDYWGGRPHIDKIYFKVISGEMTGEEALLSEEIDIINNSLLNQSMLNMFLDNPSLKVKEINVAQVRWLMLNNELINSTMRKALSYAVNCAAINEFFVSSALEKSPIPINVLYHNMTGINVPYYNVAIARQVLKDAGWPGTENLTVNGDISPENDWEVVANSSTPLATYNYTGWEYGFFEFDVNHTGAVLVENLKQIGVKLELVSVPYHIWEWMCYNQFGYHRNMLEITFRGWLSDYNDPSNFINSHYTTKNITWFGNYNVGQVNDTFVQQWMEEAIFETDPNVRRQLYYQILKRLIEEVYPNIWLHSPVYYDVMVSNLEGYYPNWYRPFYYKNVKFN